MPRHENDKHHDDDDEDDTINMYTSIRIIVNVAMCDVGPGLLPHNFIQDKLHSHALRNHDVHRRRRLLLDPSSTSIRSEGCLHYGTMYLRKSESCPLLHACSRDTATSFGLAAEPAQSLAGQKMSRPMLQDAQRKSTEFHEFQTADKTVKEESKLCCVEHYRGGRTVLLGFFYACFKELFVVVSPPSLGQDEGIFSTGGGLRCTSAKRSSIQRRTPNRKFLNYFGGSGRKTLLPLRPWRMSPHRSTPSTRGHHCSSVRSPFWHRPSFLSPEDSWHHCWPKHTPESLSRSAVMMMVRANAFVTRTTKPHWPECAADLSFNS